MIFSEFFNDFKKIGVVRQVLFVVIIAAVLAFGLYHFDIIHIPQALARNCTQTAADTVVVVIRDNAFVPSDIRAHICDRLEFKNEDKIFHEPALGEHPHHAYYPEFESEEAIVGGESHTVVLNRMGFYLLHDHLHEEIQGQLTIEDR